MKKKALLVVSGLVLIPLMSLWLCNFGDERSNKDSKIDQRNTIAMYIEGEDGEYSQSNESTFPKEGYVLNMEKSNCRNGGSLSQDESTKAISLSVENSDLCTLYFDKEKVPTSEDTLAILGVTSNGVKSDFDAAATTDEGIFEMEDDYGTSYYYRGAVENNYVKFAGFFWRIIRINGDGSLRIIYDGTYAHENGSNAGANSERFVENRISFNDHGISPDTKYVGWMYGPTGTTSSKSKEEAQSNIVDSYIKKRVDSWYKAKIEDAGYGNVIVDGIFCNDRSSPGKTATGYSSDTGLGYGTNATAYGATARTGVWNSSTTPSAPTFKCPQKNDAFTVNDTSKGNGASTYPVGLITADEVVAAGSGKYGTHNKAYYLYRAVWYWTMSPNNFYQISVYMLNVNHTYGNLGMTTVRDDGGVAPVINLSAEYVKTMTGTGTMTEPYQAV